MWVPLCKSCAAYQCICLGVIALWCCGYALERVLSGSGQPQWKWGETSCGNALTTPHPPHWCHVHFCLCINASVVSFMKNGETVVQMQKNPAHLFLLTGRNVSVGLVWGQCNNEHLVVGISNENTVSASLTNTTTSNLNLIFLRHKATNETDCVYLLMLYIGSLWPLHS